MDYKCEKNNNYKYLTYFPSVMEKWEYILYHSKDDVISNFENGLQELHNIEFDRDSLNRTLFAGGVAAFDKGIIQFLHKWNEKIEPLFLLSEVTGEFKRYTADEVHFPFICTPHLLSKEIVIRDMALDENEEARLLYDKLEYIREAVANINACFKNLGKNYATVWTFYAYQYINLLLDRLKPMRVILWNEFYAFHIIFKNICYERKIDICFMEFGCVPGTFSLDVIGQQGESWVALHHCKKYNNTSEAGKIIHYMNEKRLNRNIQPLIQFNRSDIV